MPLHGVLTGRQSFDISISFGVTSIERTMDNHLHTSLIYEVFHMDNDIVTIKGNQIETGESYINSL